MPSAPAPGAALASSSGVAASEIRNPKSGKAKKGSRSKNPQDKGVTFPTVDEIPVVAPVDVASLPEDVRAYRQERAKNWPGRAREEARDENDAETAAAAEAEAAERKARRRARLAEVLAEQRRLGHFEASEEIGELVGGGPGDTKPYTDRPGDRKKGRGAKGGGRGGGAPREPRPAPRGAQRDWTGGAARPSPFEAGTVPEAKRRRVDGDGDGDGDGDVPRRPREKTRACRFWNAGGCRRGDACGFRHDGEPGTRAGAPGPYAAAVGPEGTSAGDGTDGGAADAPSGNADVPGVPGDGRRAGDIPGDAGDAKRAPPPPCRHHARGRCAAGASCGFAHGAAARRGGDARPPSVRKNDKSDPRRSGTATGASDQTLLKKLFAKEVRVDRARLLQVFRFLAANDFLRAETRLDALWVFPWADDPERDPQREKQRLRKLALEAAEAQEEEEEEETKR